jgi:hypothetical protein
MCGTKGGGKLIGLAGVLPRERTLNGNVYTLTVKVSTLYKPERETEPRSKEGSGPRIRFSKSRRRRNLVSGEGLKQRTRRAYFIEMYSGTRNIVFL